MGLLHFLRVLVEDWDEIQWWCPKGCYGISDEPGFCGCCGSKLLLRKYFKCVCGVEMSHPDFGSIKTCHCGKCGKSWGERLKEIELLSSGSDM